MFNAGMDAVNFILPRTPTDSPWRLIADTARASPRDIWDAGTEQRLENTDGYQVAGRSSVILLAGTRESRRPQAPRTHGPELGDARLSPASARIVSIRKRSSGRSSLSNPGWRCSHGVLRGDG